MGFESVASGPLVRSSYHADEQVPVRRHRRLGDQPELTRRSIPHGAAEAVCSLAASLIPLKDNLPTDHFPVMTAVIIAINVAVFLVLPGPLVLGRAGRDEAGRRVRRDPLPRSPTRTRTARVQVELRTSSPASPRQQTRLSRDARIRASAQQAGHDRGPSTRRRRSLTLFTSMFMHGGWLHIIFNMLFLWIFGNNIEDSMGRLRFVALLSDRRAGGGRWRRWR